jgi:hypothetical protein
MGALVVNGVTFPVAIDSLKVGLESVGTKGRNTRGHALLERRRAKWRFEFDLSLCPLDEAQMYRALILGEGEYWSTVANAYGSKGLALSGTGAFNGAGGGNPISGNGVWRTTTGQTLVVPGRLFDQAGVSPANSLLVGATLIGWRYDGSAYRIFGFSWRAGDTVVATKREKLGSLGSSGAAQAYTGTETLATSNGTLTITAPGAGGPWSWSNMYLLPWFLGDSLVDTLMDGWASLNTRLPMLPRVLVMSDHLPDNQFKASPGASRNSIACIGEVSEMRVTPVARGGSWQTAETALSGVLEEV